MKTTTNLPDELIDKAKKAFPGYTKTTILIMGVQELLAKKAWEDFKKLKGTVDLHGINLDVLRDRRHHKWNQK